MRPIVPFILILFLSQMAWGQNCHYGNASGESLILQGDTVFLCLNNHDAFGSYGIYYGPGRISKATIFKSRAKLHLGPNLVDNQACELKEADAQSPDETKIIIERSDGSPLEFCEVSLIGDGNRPLGRVRADKQGSIILDSGLATTTKAVQIKGLEIDLMVNLKLTAGHDYNIRSRMTYPFTKIRTNRLALKMDSDVITIVHNKRRHVLIKRGSHNEPLQSSNNLTNSY